MKKQIKEIKEYAVIFSGEEMSELNIKPNDKFSVKPDGDSIVLEKYKTIELELEEFSKDQLIDFIVGAHERGETIEEYIEYILSKIVENHQIDPV